MILQSSNTLVKHLVNNLRNLTTSSYEFRTITAQISKLLCAQALENVDMVEKKITTWNGSLKTNFIDESQIVLIPILRAGEPMLTGLMDLLPNSKSGFLAMKREESSAISKIYYQNLPDLKDKTIFVLDPMVATGGSLIDAISIIKEQNPKEIISLNIIGSAFGIDALDSTHPDIKMYIAQIDDKLDKQNYICPGLGDAGDRAFNT